MINSLCRILFYRSLLSLEISKHTTHTHSIQSCTMREDISDEIGTHTHTHMINTNKRMSTKKKQRRKKKQ
jgi:hypothetical protein